jgi:hypothetical protein
MSTTTDPRLPPEHTDAILACAELCHRSGATQFEVGYLDDDVPTDQARWWAKAQYRGDRLHVDEQPSPAHACQALATRILGGGHCTTCGVTVTTTTELAAADAQGLQPASQRCVWARHGPHWIAGCVDPTVEAARLDSATARRAPSQPLNRAQRRTAGRRRP